MGDLKVRDWHLIFNLFSRFENDGFENDRFLRFQDFNKKACLDIAELYKNPKFNREYVRRRDDLKREKQAEVTDKRLEVSNSKRLSVVPLGIRSGFQSFSKILKEESRLFLVFAS